MINRIGSKDGFTLIELLVVMVIIGLLAGLVGPKLFRHVDTAKTKDAFAQIAMLEEALDLYRLDHSRYPTANEGLKVLVSPPADEDTPNGGKWTSYLRKDLPNDPWGKPYIYNVPGTNNREYEIVSYGADGEQGGEGADQDIYNWKGLK